MWEWVCADDFTNTKTVTYREWQLLLIKQQDSVYAVEDCCSHERARLSAGELEDGVIICPRHGASFDYKSGAALSLPATKPLRVFPAKLVGGDIYLDLKEET